MTPKEATDNLDTSHLEELLEHLEKLSRHGDTKDHTSEKKKIILDHVRFLVAKAVFSKI